jgi:hypothetical protein
MLIGPGVNQLEQRITDALCSGTLRLKESGFLQDISRKVGLYRECASLSPAQASWLYTILTNFEQQAERRLSSRPMPASPSTVAPPPSSSEKASESHQLERAHAGLDGVIWTEEKPPRGFDLSEALVPEGSD